MMYDQSLLIKLGLDPDEIAKLSDQDKKKAVKKKYFELANKYHPDKWNPEESDLSYEQTAREFMKIHHAYKMMTDATYREEELKKESQGQQIKLDAFVNINLTFEQAFFGRTITTSYNPIHLNPDGSVKTVDEENDVYVDLAVIDVEIPKNTQPGSKIKYPEMGMKQGDRQGDLYFVLNVLPHPDFRYEHEEKTFYVTEYVPLETMLGGGRIEVSTIWGLMPLRVPAGSRPNDTLTLRGPEGHKDFKVNVTLTPKYPEKEDLKTKDFWKNLGVDWEEEEEINQKEKEQEEEFQRLYDRLNKSRNVWGMSVSPEWRTFGEYLDGD